MKMRTLLGIILLLTIIGSLPLFFPGDIRAQDPAINPKIVIVLLQNQEQAAVAQAVQAEYGPRLEGLSEAVQSAGVPVGIQAQRPTLKTREEEIAYAQQAAAGQLTSAAAQEAHAQASRALEAAQRNMRQEILARSAAARQASQTAVAQAVEQFGGEVIYRYNTINGMAVGISPDAEAALAAHPEVAAIVEDQLMTAQLNVSGPAIGANAWWASGYDGGIWDVAILDTGIDNSHPALSTHRFIENRCLATADYWQSGLPNNDPTPDDVNGHGTHIAGIVASTDSTYRGISYGLDVLINGKAGFDYDGNDGGSGGMYYADGMACADWALTNNWDDADVINLSYGGPATTDDGDYERFWDAVVDQMDAVVTIAAGNYNPFGTYGIPTVGTPSTAYNVISVANVNVGGTVSRDDDTIWGASSHGPTPGGRKKPDLAAPGTSIDSTNNNWEATYDFVALSGTSMAAPHVAGAATLLLDRGVTNPMAIKALLINTAEKKGSPDPDGWDEAYGWGYIDLNHLGFHIFDYFAAAIAPSPAYQFYAGPASAGDLATLVWHRRAVYAGDSFPSTYYWLTDLNLYLYNESDNGLIDDSVDPNDNVEQVEANAGFDSVVVKVDSPSSSIAGAAWEAYALATEENFVAKTGPVFQIVPTTFNGDLEGLGGTIIDVSARVDNVGDLAAHNVTLELNYSSGLTKLSGNDTENLGTIDDGSGSAAYSWQFSKDDDSLQVIWLNASSSSYDEVFTGTLVLGGIKTYLPLILK